MMEKLKHFLGSEFEKEIKAPTKKPIQSTKLEGLLSSLNMQLRLEEARNLKDTHLTSYFNRS